MQARVADSEGAGLIGIDAHGRVARAHNAPRMSWAAVETVAAEGNGAGAGARVGVCTAGVEAHRPVLREPVVLNGLNLF
jgi:hypothetical protein